MSRRPFRVTIGITLSIATIGVAGAKAQPYFYPARGQNPQPQQHDRYECHGWAVQQSGFDPSVAQAPVVATAPPQGGAVRGAAGGATLGAIGGAIAGDAEDYDDDLTVRPSGYPVGAGMDSGLLRTARGAASLLASPPLWRSLQLWPMEFRRAATLVLRRRSKR